MNKKECISKLEGILNSWVIPEIEYQIDYCKEMVKHKENLSPDEYEEYIKTIKKREEELEPIKNILEYRTFK